ncbi:hypothetical protein JZO80_02915 [Vagococcus fluvialis]|uniref:hypothetical protein n=1 Tax=Vagococcus fluvialis TaxID=2738 RepID=UPI000A3552DA|nr:hypothetical protein [Vagococcus fluvialis]MBO0419100.1 hypothetical protein [Vagococcus fluvialis]OTP29525.1 hypothetical protein A5798_002693 [Enterococcus sp. 6C8_DIV0013]
MLLKVLKPFIDKHTKETYEIGQEIEVTEKRGFEIIYSTILGPSFVVPILDEVNDNEGDNQDVVYPHHTGGGHYELSNGEKVKGKEAAIEAEAALQEQE